MKLTFWVIIAPAPRQNKNSPPNMLIASMQYMQHFVLGQLKELISMIINNNIVAIKLFKNPVLKFLVFDEACWICWRFRPKLSANTNRSESESNDCFPQSQVTKFWPRQVQAVWLLSIVNEFGDCQNYLKYEILIISLSHPIIRVCYVCRGSSLRTCINFFV